MRPDHPHRGRRATEVSFGAILKKPALSHNERLLRPVDVPPTKSPFCILLVLISAFSSACSDRDTTPGGGGGEGGGGGGNGGASGCLVQPQPTFALHVSAADQNPIPPDTTVYVAWSAGIETPFKLDEMETWGTLETSNVVCDVDPMAGPPSDLKMLSCVLWTSSPTEVKVTAKGYATVEGTYSELPSAECQKEPTPIDVVLEPEDK